ncbi:6-carboxyhexanoate--CoA ligase [Salibacterium salarium]|uniref:6-carboxyhexanoate--CoA ligase n=1 Tax=Salibacterium salarium TaxID=284579 RepID=A0A428MVE5_9BACI|nr:6-carboxyhexanoate--CoA ligase [Salibacterium salarium]RSL30074.1 6-carboxyhexanoate--CoA ligase [Salibacterium salarium]
MGQSRLYSVRMRASEKESHENGGSHISGGELLSTYSELRMSVDTLLEKALNHSRGKPDFLQIQCEIVNQPIKLLNPLTVQTNVVNAVEEGQELARYLLEKTGVHKGIIEKTYKEIPEYPVRGAILIDIHTGERVDQRIDKGVRVSRMDWQTKNFEKWATSKSVPTNPRLKEALTLATKVCNHQSTIAELCWSDDPDYIMGYVASKNIGYHRITQLKDYDDERGCRIFFVDTLTDINTYMSYLEEQPILVQWEEEEDHDTRVD